MQVRGFWRNVWFANEAKNPQRVLTDVMGYLADGTIVPDSGEPPRRNALLTFEISEVEQSRSYA